MVIVNNCHLFINFYLFIYLFLFFNERFITMKSPIKFRWIIVIAVVVFTFNSVNDALKRSDYNHCLVTSKMSKQQCSVVTGYVINK